MTALEKPYSLGFNNHAKCCDCEKCATARAKRTTELWEQNGSYAVPKSADATVLVRSYFRRQSNHYNKMPNTRRIMRELIRTIRNDKGD